MPTWPRATSATNALKSSRSCIPAADLPRSPSNTSMSSGWPAQVFGPMDQGPLRERTVAILTHVLRARLAHGEDRLAIKMSRGNVHLAQTAIEGHGSSPQLEVGSADGPATVGQCRGAPGGHAVAGRLTGGSTAEGVQ